jgi:hypothetical protein
MKNPFGRFVLWLVVFIAALAIGLGLAFAADGVTEAAPASTGVDVGAASPAAPPTNVRVVDGGATGSSVDASDVSDSSKDLRALVAAVAGAPVDQSGPRGGLSQTGTVPTLLAPVLNALTAKSGWVLALLTWMATLRFLGKPVMTAIERYVRNSPSKADDQVLDEVEHSRWFVVGCWLLDFLASVKFGPQFAAVRGENLSDAGQQVKPPSQGANSGKGGGNSNGIVTAAGMAFIMVGVALMFTGCAALKPGADALVVRAEQTETLADSTFGLFLHLENDQRGFYRTNAPELHALAEWLRQPQVIDGVSYARADAMIVSLNGVKRAYKASRGTEAGAGNSNLLVTAIATISESARQASGWLNVITNRSNTNH